MPELNPLIEQLEDKRRDLERSMNHKMEEFVEDPSYDRKANLISVIEEYYQFGSKIEELF